MGGRKTDDAGRAGGTGVAEATGSSGMGGAGSGGDSATGTGAPPGAGGPGGQPVAPEPTRSRPVEGSGSGRTVGQAAHGPDDTGDITGGVPEPSAAGAREDTEAGGMVGQEETRGGESAGGRPGEFPADAESVGDVKVAEGILGSVLGDREPDQPDSPRSNPS